MSAAKIQFDETAWQLREKSIETGKMIAVAASQIITGEVQYLKLG